MNQVDLSVAVDDLRLEIKSALQQARAMGLHHIDIDATRGAISPQALSQSGRRHFARHLSDLGLRLDSLRGPTGGAGYADAAGGERRLETIKSILSLASELRVPIVSTTLGGFDAKYAEQQASRLHEALIHIADHADRSGVAVAIETAGIEAAQLAALLRKINCPLLAACCDSGAMLMQGENPHRIADVLPGKIRLVRARDALCGTDSASGSEMAMGQGQLDPAAFLAGLAEAGFRGPLVLSRTTGGQPRQDLMLAKQVFEALLVK